MATVEQLTIQFQGRGAKQLTNQLRALSAAMDRLAKRQRKAAKGSRKLSDGMFDISNRGRLLSNSFATMRSKMLLFNFAMALGVNQVIRFAREAAKVESMARGFNTLTGATENSTVALDKLKEATNGTMSEFDLFQQANNAMILGVTKNSDEMAEMFDIAQRLGRSLGRDTRTSIESLVTGIGRQSRLMLDNIGIITKVGDANEKYARSLGKSVDQLTDTERRQAFFNATMEAARFKVALLGDEVLTTQDSFDQFDSAMSNLRNNIGEGLGGAFLPLMDVMVKFSEVMNPERIRAYANVILGTLVVALGAYIRKLEITIITQTRLGWGALATAAGFLAAEILVMSGAFDKAEDSIDLTGQKAEAAAQSLMKLSLAELINQQATLKAIVTDSFNPYKQQMDLIEKYIAILKNGFPNIENYNDAITQSKDLYRKTPQAQKQLIESQIKMIKSLINTTGETSELIAVLEMLEGQLIKTSKISPEFAESLNMWGQYNAAVTNVTNSFEKMKLQSIENDKQKELSAANSIRSERRRQRAIDKINKEYDEKTRKAKEDMKDVKVAEAISNTALGVTKAYSEGKWILATLIGIQGAMQVATINAQKYATGGLVGGRRHSQGGTMIEAEQGEYVVSRAGVESIGVEALNRINAGGGSAVNITFSGNVMSKDFIEDEAIPQIKEAIRRGADIGVG